MKDKTVFVNKETTTVIDADGNEQTTIKETSRSVSKIDEPEYIKIYCKVYADFHSIPPAYQALFYELAKRMTYCDATDLAGSQIVRTGKLDNESILKALGWKQNMFQKGLAALVNCGAIRKVKRDGKVLRGVYQVNPNFAGKGPWKYDPKQKQGGIENLRASFAMGKDGMKWESEIIWADNGEDTEENEMWRNGLDTKPQDETVLKEIRVTNNDNAEGNDDWAMDELLFVDPNQTEIQTGIGDGGSR